MCYNCAMSEIENEGQQQEAPQETPQQDQSQTPSSPAFSISPEEWQQTQQALRALAQRATEVPGEQQEEEYEELDVDEYINSRIQQGINQHMEPMRPLLDATVRERGERVMQEHFAAAKKNPETSDFDENLAERVAQSFLAEVGGDPLKALNEGIKYAVENRKGERAAGKQKVLASLGRGPQDYEPGNPEGSAVKTKKAFKTYDEVIDDRIASENEI